MKTIYVVHRSHREFIQDAMAEMGRREDSGSVTITQGRVCSDQIEYLLISNLEQLRGLRIKHLEIWGEPAGINDEFHAAINMAIIP